MFQKLIQGFDTFHSSAHLGATSMGIDLLNAEAQKVFNIDTSQSGSSILIGKSIYPFEITPIIPVQPNEHQLINQQQQLLPMQQQQLNQQQFQQNPGLSGIFNLTAEMLKEVLEYMQQDVI